ncbi:ABC transporter ATP-binding protein [Actinoalloteichus hymeniacidonis]|uniref:ABC-type nitrate/sulfonate/bicarbonate transport system, ATPase component n=1 Tax=Actinoalloteichus hymeniacidonis TaxID=340345 RepID=A0AAC9MYX8_9PSEU|nr:ABC transporter ATP-binding protein [Actinoalloteichus hymeniacidonis]AOS63346.1 ABC-type nitrate/sulfonate/bicarbonate transport system, ATPase component [Actinoalloteichus hymeniacidonis]MBB5908614.1 sulfonate transport system ATP-binding protein [Actinoalloteichus hymeniacidonis]
MAGDELTGNTVRVRSLSRSFGSRTVLADLDLDIARGEFVALLGRSGSGKSTLLRILAGLDREITGTATVAGTVSVAFQQPRLLPWRRVWRNVVIGLRVPATSNGSSPETANPPADPSRPRNHALALRALGEVGLSDLAEAWPRTLSGGEAQRLSLARALVREPDLLLLDEPFGALDALTRLTMHRLVENLWQHHHPSILLVTHDVDEALSLADRVLVLDAGRIGAEYRPARERPRRIADHLELRAEVLTDLGVTDSAYS